MTTRVAPTEYRRSWVDALIANVRRLPGPSWLFYLIGTLLLVAVGTGLTWIDGSQPVGTFSFVRVFNDATVLYQLAVIHYLTTTARTALASFAPASGDLAPEYGRLEHEFTTMPRPLVWVGTVFGVLYGVLFLIVDPGGFGITDDSSVPSWVFGGVTAVLSGILFVVLVFFVLRLMVLIVRVHARATNVSVFDAPAHGAFARLTLRSSIGLGLPVYVFTSYQLVAGNPDGAITIPEAITVIALVGGAIGVFFIPLSGIHRRLVRQKAALVAAIDTRFAATMDEVHASADTRSLAGIGDLNTLLEALGRERDVVRRLSTWPWEGETLRGLLSSIALPIALWLVTTLLGRLLGE